MARISFYILFRNPRKVYSMVAARLPRSFGLGVWPPTGEMGLYLRMPAEAVFTSTPQASPSFFIDSTSMIRTFMRLHASFT